MTRNIKSIILLLICISFLGCNKTQKISNSELEKNDDKTNLSYKTESEIVEFQDGDKESSKKNETSKFKCWIKSPEGLRVRKAQTLDSDVITVLENNREVDVIEVGQLDRIDNKYSFWLRIKTDSIEGWIFSAYVSVVPEKIKTDEEEELEVNYENLLGNWFSGYVEYYPNVKIEQASYYMTFFENNFYRSGLNYRGFGQSGTYILEDKTIQTKYTMIGEPDPTEYETNFYIKKLTETTLIYTQISSEKEYVEDKILHRYPKTVLELRNKTMYEWLNYINIYGNQEFYNGTNLFMYSLVSGQYEVALLLFHSGLKNINAQKCNISYSELVPDVYYQEEILKYLKKELEYLEKEQELGFDNFYIAKNKYYRINNKDGVKVRELENPMSKVINTYPDNYVVYVSNIGTEVEIDGIHNKWVKILHNNDPAGWIFGGYLKEIEPFPKNALDENEYRYTDYKTSYGTLTPTMLDENWESFYIFSKDYVGEPQQFVLDCYDMYTSLTYDDYKIFSGLYKDKQGKKGYFIVKMDLEEQLVLDMHVKDSDDNSIVFFEAWGSDYEYLSVGRKFYSEYWYYISTNNMAARINWNED